MEEIKYSKALNLLIAHAKKVGASSSETLTAERFMVAVFDVVLGELDLDDVESYNKVKRLIAASPNEPDRDKTLLLAHINDSQKSSFMDGIFMQKKLMEAKTSAQKENLSEVTVELVLKKILEEPTAAIKSGYSSKTEDSEEKKTGSFDDFLKSKKTDAEPEQKAKPEQAEEPAANPRERVAKLTEKVKKVQSILLDSVYGQDNAVSVFTAGYFQAELLSMTDKKRTRPRATFLFAGPPGVGKTFLAEKAAEALGLPFMRFDMSEYSDHEANIEFCGSDKVYKNAKAGNVTSFVSENNKCVILFDEIEKAHLCVIHLFLQILDAGRIRDNYTDEEVPFTDAIMIFTTNAGRKMYEQSESGDFSGVSKKMILKALEKDTNPETGASFFPAAICSRFASGNVVMFNHMAAHHLRQITRKEVLRHASNYEKEVGVKVSIDENVFSALLFAEGGSADARTVRSRAETFFDDELFELFRLIASEKTSNSIEQVEQIDITVELPKDTPEIMELFEGEAEASTLVFADDDTVKLCDDHMGGCRVFGAKEVSQASELLHNHDIKFVLLDIGFGQKDPDQKYLNAEDIDSVARDFLGYVREYYRNVPVYLLQTKGNTINHEEKLSFLGAGVRDVVSMEDMDEFEGRMKDIRGHLHQQQSMINLAKANRMISYETAQLLSDDGKKAEIRLFDFSMKLALDAEDSKNILSNVSKPNIHFDEVIGAEDAKKELRYFVEYLKNPKRYLGTGVGAPKGVLLYGPPGTGKTMLAKAMACESDVTFIAAEGNEFLNKYVGEGKERVHELFNTARKYAPAIIFVDEIDAIAKERKGGEHAMANGEDVLTAFLTNMDGFKVDPSKPVFVLAATNFDVTPGGDKSLDPALMRRFDRTIFIDLPDKEERLRYIRMKLASNPAFEVSENEIENLAIRSTGMSLAELESVFEFALRSAIREGNLKVTDAVLEEAFETYNSGEEKKWDESELIRVARHEAGHTFLCWKSGEVPSYVTIVARGNHGGYMQHGDKEQKHMSTKDDLLARIRTSLGGRAAEIVYYGEQDGLATGASGDLQNATAVAQRIICSYGMDERFGLAVVDSKAANMGELSSDVRSAVNQILADEMEKAIAQIRENTAAIDALVDRLMTKNHMTGTEIDEIFQRVCGQPQ